MTKIRGWDRFERSHEHPRCSVSCVMTLEEESLALSFGFRSYSATLCAGTASTRRGGQRFRVNFTENLAWNPKVRKFSFKRIINAFNCQLYSR